MNSHLYLGGEIESDDGSYEKLADLLTLFFIFFNSVYYVELCSFYLYLIRLLPALIPTPTTAVAATRYY
jgi:hypothetical protein